jgi:UDP-2,3-diacylglucosamine pyrophosphatase LpxH
MIYDLKEKSAYVNLGDWIEYNTYFVVNEQDVFLKSFTNASTSFIYHK